MKSDITKVLYDCGGTFISSTFISNVKVVYLYKVDDRSLLSGLPLYLYNIIYQCFPLSNIYIYQDAELTLNYFK